VVGTNALPQNLSVYNILGSRGFGITIKSFVQTAPDRAMAAVPARNKIQF
jgi:hypothetical protein